MSAQFHSGWLNTEAAWHGEGIVTQGALPAREAFETANALFDVEKRQLHYQLNNTHTGESAFTSAPHFALVRTDTQQLLGMCSRQYEIVGNDALLRMAEFIREEVEMDTVVVLRQGARVAFTAKIRGAEANVLPGDKVFGRIVGYLGHDGKSGCGAIFTNVRVVCMNTMAMAERSSNQTVITHRKGANENFDRLITSINCARQDFQNELGVFDMLANTQIERLDFKSYLESVYAKQLSEPLHKGTDQERTRTLEDLRVYPHLMRAYQSGLGASMGRGTLWNALNAVTEVETSTKRGNQKRMFYAANFGSGLQMSRVALGVATGMAEAMA